MNENIKELRTIVANAYTMFRVPTPTDDCACACCMYPEIKATFFDFSPRDLPLGHLRDWYSAAVDPEIDQNLWRHLLPRVLEFLTDDQDFVSVGTEVALQRFPTGDKTRWRDEEWELLDAFRVAYIDRLKTWNDVQLDDAICMFALAGWSPEVLFEQVFSWSDDVLVTRLSRDWFGGKIWITAFWDDEKIPHQFYTSDTFQKRLLTIVEGEERPEIVDQTYELLGAIWEAQSDGA